VAHPDPAGLYTRATLGGPRQGAPGRLRGDGRRGAGGAAGRDGGHGAGALAEPQDHDAGGSPDGPGLGRARRRG
jgi:hypothetical protein